ncbi:hypothetical protein [Metallibacterium sp.]|uniref:hypothetical protein n=1 Tax=Metallibacterium sp. TaxID=2940281 RepID=UPI0026246E0A|nr:hypothetical protein [Metallibacterium sp.]
MIAIKLGGAGRRNTYSIVRIALAAEIIMPDAKPSLSHDRRSGQTGAAADTQRSPAFTGRGRAPADRMTTVGGHSRVRDGRGMALVP